MNDRGCCDLRPVWPKQLGDMVAFPVDASEVQHNRVELAADDRAGRGRRLQQFGVSAGLWGCADKCNRTDQHRQQSKQGTPKSTSRLLNEPFEDQR